MQRCLDLFYNFINKIQCYIENNSHQKNCLLLTILYAILRFTALAPVSKSGDAVHKWRLLKIWTETGFYPQVIPDHHQGRWMLNLPVKALMEIFGTSHWVYYIYPLLCGFICALSIYFIAAKLKDKFAGVAASCIFLLFPLTTEESIQFLPMIPASAFILLALLSMFRYQQTLHIRWTFLAGILLALAYGCKITSVYYFVPFGLYLLLADPRSGILTAKCRISMALCMLMLGGILIAAGELVFLNNFFEVSRGRISMLMSGHFKDRPDPQYLSFGEYLLSFLRPFYFKGKYFMVLPRIMLFAAAIFSTALLMKKIKNNPQLTLVLGSFGVVYLMHCYVVYKFFPFLHPERPNARYLLALIILGIIIFAAAREQRHACIQKYCGKYAPFVHITFNASLLVLMLIALINPLPKGENPLQLIKQTVIFNRVDCAVIQEIKFRRNQMTTANAKYAQMYLTMYAPVTEILPSNEVGQLDLAHKQDFYQDSNGKIYRHLWGKKIADNEFNEVIICDQDQCKKSQLLLKRAKKL